jgi:hypothetical protein
VRGRDGASREGASLQSHGGGRFTAPRPRRPEKKRSQGCLESIASLNDWLLGETSPGHRPAAAFAAGGRAYSPRILGIGADSGHHEHRSPSTRVATDARGWRSTLRRSIARLVPQPGQNTSSHGVPAAQGCAASPSQMGRFETQWLATDINLSALTHLFGQWIDVVHSRRPPRGIVLDMDSSVSPTHGEQEMSRLERSLPMYLLPPAVRIQPVRRSPPAARAER